MGKSAMDFGIHSRNRNPLQHLEVWNKSVLHSDKKFSEKSLLNSHFSEEGIPATVRL